MSDHEHGHVPYLLLLLKYLEDWKQSHEGRVPESYSEKGEFKALVMNGMRVNVPGGSEENYEEAIAAVLKNLRQAEVSSGTREVFGDPKSEDLTPEVCICNTDTKQRSGSFLLTECFRVTISGYLQRP